MNVKRNPDYNKFTAPEGYRDIGWQMTLAVPEFKKCIDARHQRREFDNSLHLNRCTNVITICDECKIFWHTDMSD